MQVSSWYNLFLDTLDRTRPEKGKSTYGMRDGDWTHHVEDVFNKMQGKSFLDQWVLCRNKRKDDYSGEYLNVDAMFFDCDENPVEDCPVTHPSIIIEHENSTDIDKIKFCLWKLSCIRAKLRVLIFYKRENEISDSISQLKEFITQNKLLVKSDNLLVIVGNYTLDNAQKTVKWRDYYSGYEWKNQTFNKIDRTN